MAARSRPRGGHFKDELDEERSLWNQIRADARRIDQLMQESDKIQRKLIDLETEQNARIARGDSPSSRIDAELDSLLRENVKVTNELSGYLDPNNGNSDICTQLTLLSALRSSDDAPSSASRATSVGHSKSGRDRQNKRKLTDSIDDRDSIATDSPGGPSPKVVINQKDRLVAKAGGSRAGSVPAVREASAKPEDDKDDSGKDLSKTRLLPYTEVLYRDPKKRPPTTEGEGILCRVTNVIGDGKQRRYEIIDADPDPPTPSMPYRASVNHLVPIPPPSSNTTLPDLVKGKNVLALYPGTTTFYKAQVVVGWKVSDGLGNGGGKIKKEKGEGGEEVENLVRLRFEGEDEADREMSVERRYVLPDK